MMFYLNRMIVTTVVFAFSPMKSLRGENLQIRAFGISLSSKGESRLRINVFNLEGFSPEKGAILDLLTTKGHMRRLQRSPNTNPAIWKNWEGRFQGFVCHYAIGGWKERVGKNYGDQPRLAPRETCKKKCKLLSHQPIST